MAFKTKAEKKAFRAGMAKQYNKEHPKYFYAAATKYTTYNEDGTVLGRPHYGPVQYYKTEDEAKKHVENGNKFQKILNERVLKSVKAKKVDVFDSQKCTIKVAEYKRIKPRRNTKNSLDYKDL